MENTHTDPAPKGAPAPVPHPKGHLMAILKTKTALYSAAAMAGLFALRLGVNWFERRPAKLVLPTVEVVRPELRDLKLTLTLPANVEDIKEATIYSHVSGYLKQIFVDEGDHVKEGQLMAKIYAPDVMQQYNRDKSNYDFLEITRKRYETLLKGQVISQQEYDQAKAQADEAKARLDNDLANISYTEIRAPFSGEVARRFKYPGDLIQKATSNTSQSPIFVVANEDTVRVVVNVPEVDVAEVGVGDPAVITSDANPTLKIKGRITGIDSILDETTKTQRVLVDIPNPKHVLSAGMYVHVAIYVKSVSGALSIPVTDLDQTSTPPSVFVVADGKVARRNVTTGIITGKYAQITQGIGAQDEIVTGSDAAAFEGLKVRVKIEKPKERED